MKYMILSVLITMVLGSAVGVIVSRHQSRSLFIDLQTLERLRDDMQIEWGKLQLELSTWATHGRIEQLARTQLGMSSPGLGGAAASE